MEDSSKISDDLGLNKRELFGLILLAHMSKHLHPSADWVVGYDASEPEPNDGFVSDGTTKTLVEHKLVPQIPREDALEAILSTYIENAEKGDAYGRNRVLIIYANRATRGLVRVSRLRDEIQDDCPFEQVLLMV